MQPIKEIAMLGGAENLKFLRDPQGFIEAVRNHPRGKKRGLYHLHGLQD
jgi:hypothetical protein